MWHDAPRREKTWPPIVALRSAKVRAAYRDGIQRTWEACFALSRSEWRHSRREASCHNLARWLLVLVACIAVAHGCHRGGHGEEDLLIQQIMAWGSSPAAAFP
ncbi:MAG: hypothetical protein EXS09_18830 [Gemmataceae bacterium]|nr:hypothetical protein [Gemmataceae bacterium]